MSNRRALELPGAVLDTSVFVAGFLSKRGASAEILRYWREQQSFQLIVSDPVLVEVAETLLEETEAEMAVLAFLRVVHNQALFTTNSYIINAVPADPDDNIFLAAALEGQANYLVSLDKHLLALKHYHGVQIVWPKDFLKLIRSIRSIR